MKSKKVYLYGIFIKIISILSILIFDYVFIWSILEDNVSVEYILIILIMFIFTIFVFLNNFCHYIYYNKKTNKIIISLSISNKNKIIRNLDTINKIELELKDNGFQIVLIHKQGNYRENVFYRFNRFSFVEKMQLKRVSRSLNKYNQLLLD